MFYVCVYAKAQFQKIMHSQSKTTCSMLPHVWHFSNMGDNDLKLLPVCAKP